MPTELHLWDICTTIFDQTVNLSANEDVIKNFKQLTLFIVVASLQISLVLFKNTLNLDPYYYNLNISTIITNLFNPFVLATTHYRFLLYIEQIQYTIKLYNKIRKPESCCR